MFGFFMGTLGALGLYALLRGRRGHWFRRGHPGGWGRPRGRWFLRRVFERLDTSPSQEEVIRKEFDLLRRRASDFRDELRASRDDVARALRGDDFDETIFGDVFTRHDDRLREMRLDVVGAVARVHDALDERQRAQLAGFVEGDCGHRRSRDRGPYRSAA